MLKNIKITTNNNNLTQFFLILKKHSNINYNIYKDNTIICLSQKLFNPKGTIFIKKNLNTFSVGSIIKYFQVKQSKYIRRSLKGTKIFLNFYKNILLKKYTQLNTRAFLVKVNGFDYNLFFFKSFFKSFFKLQMPKSEKNMFLILNMKIPFTKKKDKRIKSIKKRLRKKIILNFIKNVK